MEAEQPETRADRQAKAWRRIAALAGFGFLGGSVPYLGCAFTFGIISGLIVILVPLYPVLFQIMLVVVAVALSLAARRHALARVLGTVLSLAPALAAVGAYTNARIGCERAQDAAACVAYLNGDPPLLPIAVGVYLVPSMVGAAIVLFVVRSDAAVTA